MPRKARIGKSKYSDAKLRKMTWSEITEPLNESQCSFAEHFAKTNNTRLSAEKAGYVVPIGSSIPYKLLNTDGVVDYIRWIKIRAADQMLIDVNDLISMYARMAMYDVSDYVDLIDGKMIVKDLENIDTQIVQEIKETKHGTIEIKFADRIKALDRLAEYISGTPADYRMKLEQQKLDILQEKLELEKLKVGIGVEQIDDGFLEALDNAAENIDASIFENFEQLEQVEAEVIGGTEISNNED